MNRNQQFQFKLKFTPVIQLLKTVIKCIKKDASGVSKEGDTYKISLRSTRFENLPYFYYLILVYRFPKFGNKAFNI